MSQKPHTKIKDLLRGKPRTKASLVRGKQLGFSARGGPTSGWALPLAISRLGRVSLWLIIVVVLIAAGGAGYYAYISYKAYQEIKTPEIVKSEQIVDETAGWKVYRNEQYGFEVKYPKEWREPVETKPPYPAEGVLYLYLVGFYKSIGQEEGFEVAIYEKHSDLDYTGVDKGVGLPLKGKEILETCSKPTREVSIGVEKYPAKIVYVFPEDVCFRATYFYILQKGNYNYILTPIPNGGIGYVGYDGKVETEKHLPEFYQILSTFKFIK